MAPHRSRHGCVGADTCSATTNSTASASTGGKDLVGWVLESSGRGTLSLITSCLFTVFLCTWVVIHPRVEKRRSIRHLHKIALFFKAVVAPELIAVEGLQEWSQARRTVESCSEATQGRLKLIHAFYIGMLALRYHTPHGGDKVIWPNQYAWLLQQHLVDWDDHASWGLSEAEIRDKSNADGSIKLAALCQVCWFVAQSIMRAAHDLPLAQLESMTLSYIPLFAVTYFFWWLKPKDIMTPSVVHLPEMSAQQKTIFDSMAVSHKFDHTGGPPHSLWIIWSLTPRVFEKEAADTALREAQRLAALHLAQHAKDEQTRKVVVEQAEAGNLQKSNTPTPTTTTTTTKCNSMPSVHLPKETVLSYWDPDLYHSHLLWPVTCLFGASFGALHLISWDMAFPSTAELWLWRGAAISSVVSMLVFMQYEKVVLRWGGPLTILSLLSPVMYLLSRLVMMAGVVASFRAEDPRVYETYVVSNYWVHVL